MNVIHSESVEVAHPICLNHAVLVSLLTLVNIVFTAALITFNFYFLFIDFVMHLCPTCNRCTINTMMMMVDVPVILSE